LDLYEATILTAKQQAVFNISKQKTSIGNLEEFEKKCNEMGVEQNEITDFLHDTDIQNYIASGDAHFSVSFDHKTQKLKVSLFEKQQQNTLGVMILSKNINQIYHLLHYFKEDDQPLVLDEIDR
jgi:hypothetical protein